MAQPDKNPNTAESPDQDPVELPLLTEPAQGVPAVIDHDDALAACAQALAAGSGPVAVDAERASGFRYGQRAFLVQLKRQGAGIWLIDPEAFDSLVPVQRAISDAEWILHAATQDLPCLAELGMNPHRLFDTEHAARMTGLPKVGLGAVVEQLLGVRLAKEHSAADWSQRPLPTDWLRYAALDVELLIELRAALLELLEKQGKLAWAQEEFEYLRTWRAAQLPAEDRWRKTSGLNRLKSPKKLAVLRQLWRARESLAQKRDQAPSRILPDKALIAAADAMPSTIPQLLSVPGFHGRGAKREGPRWLRAIETGQQATDLPERKRTGAGPPAPRTWKDRDPTAYARLYTARSRIARQAEQLSILPETLLTPAVLKQLCWQPPQSIDFDTVSHELKKLGARDWQVQQVAAVLTVALLDPEEPVSS